MDKNLLVSSVFGLRPHLSRALDYIVGLANVHSIVRVSQETIGDALNIRREQANANLGKLHKMGLIRKIYRHRDTCIYEVHPLFSNGGVRKVLSTVMNSLRYFPLVFMAMVSPAIKGKFPKGIYPKSRIDIGRTSSCIMGLDARRHIDTPCPNDPCSCTYYNDGMYIPAPRPKKQALLESLIKSSDPEIHKIDRTPIYINKSYINTLSPKPLSHLERIGEFKKQKGVEMFEFPHVIEKLSIELRLTMAGKCRLASFSDGALEHARSLLGQNRGIGNRFAWVFSVARNYSVQNKLYMDVKLSRQLQSHFKVKMGDAPCEIEPPVVVLRPVFTRGLEIETQEQRAKSDSHVNGMIAAVLASDEETVLKLYNSHENLFSFMKPDQRPPNPYREKRDKIMERRKPQEETYPSLWEDIARLDSIGKKQTPEYTEMRESSAGLDDWSAAFKELE